MVAAALYGAPGDPERLGQLDLCAADNAGLPIGRRQHPPEQPAIQMRQPRVGRRAVHVCQLAGGELGFCRRHGFGPSEISRAGTIWRLRFLGLISYRCPDFFFAGAFSPRGVGLFMLWL